MGQRVKAIEWSYFRSLISNNFSFRNNEEKQFGCLPREGGGADNIPEVKKVPSTHGYPTSLSPPPLPPSLPTFPTSTAMEAGRGCMLV